VAAADAGSAVLVLRLCPELLAEVDSVARRLHLSRSAVVRLALAAAVRSGARLVAP